MAHIPHRELRYAHAAGAKIQWYSYVRGWLDTEDPIWLQETLYRVKPEPLQADYAEVELRAAAQVLGPKPHKHARVIKEWAKGEPIEFRPCATGVEWEITEHPIWLENVEYRVAKSAKTPHVHAELIARWADGAEIEEKCPTTGKWGPCNSPHWYKDLSYRIAPDKLAVQFAVIRDPAGDDRISVIYLDAACEDTAGASFFGDGDEIISRSETFYIPLEEPE